jgi:HEPN superfamily RiboL-PSP-like protein
MTASPAFHAFDAAVREVYDLERASPTASGAAPSQPAVTRSVGRAGIVLLCSHFERYFYAVNEDAVAAVNACCAQDTAFSRRLPKEMRLLHSRLPIEEIASTGWERRQEKLQDLMSTDGWLWHESLAGELDHSRLLAWLKSPRPESLIRYYRYWRIPDIFSAITRLPRTRQAFFLQIKGLVEKRNNIAHGDPSEAAPPRDVRRYASSAREFCRRADRALSRQFAKLFGTSRPW